MKIIGYLRATKISGISILGKPMLWWVLNQGKKATFIDEIFVLPENETLAKVAIDRDCQIISDKVNQIFDPDFTKNPHVRNEFMKLDAVHDEIISKTGSYGDILVYLDCQSCLMTAEVLEEMFVELMETPCSSEIIPVERNDTYLLMKDSKSGLYCPFLFEPNIDRQYQPVLYSAGQCRIQYAGANSRYSRKIYREIGKEYILEVRSPEDVELAEYYLGLRLGGEIRFTDSISRET